MKRLSLLSVLVGALWVANSAFAIDSFKMPEDPQILERYQALSEEFRCLVCQNQNLADSSAELAVDLKLEVIRLLESGKSDDEIRLFLTDRYGDFVLYRPPLKISTLLLWFGPLAVALLGVFFVIRRKNSVAPLEGDNAEEKETKSESSDDYIALLRGDDEPK